MSAYPEFSVEQREEQPYVGATAAVQMGNFAPAADQIPQIFGWLGEQGIAPLGAPFFRYLVIDMASDLIIQVGVPVAEVPASAGPWETDVLPAGRYVTTTFVGHPDKLIDVTRDLLDWADREGLVFEQHDSEAGHAWGSRLEVYESNPMEVDIDAWQTTLAFKLAD